MRSFQFKPMTMAMAAILLVSACASNPTEPPSEEKKEAMKAGMIVLCIVGTIATLGTAGCSFGEKEK